ncbi:MAG: hypothetical protein NYU90_01715 [Aigarchaeota archaeon]|nr:hypothetical protein [Candidatus Calditenuis fumarioli]
MTVDEEILEEVTKRVHRQIYDRYGKSDYVTLRALIRRFMEFNPRADPLEIDWLGHYDPSLTYDELLESFKRAYPMYRWDRPREPNEEEFEEMRRQKVEQVLAELDDEAIEILRRKLLASKSEEVAQKEEKEARQETVKPRGLVITLQTLSKFQYLDEYRQLIEAWNVADVDEATATRAKERLIDALQRGERGIVQSLDDPLTEALSFIVAKVICLAINDDWLLKRWALAEASRIERQMLAEDEETFRELIRRTKLDAEPSEIEGYDYKVPLADYLTAARNLLRNPEWRLVNRTVHRGYVHLTKAELARLARERIAEAFARFEGVRPKINLLPDVLREAAEDTLKELIRVRSRYVETTETTSEDWPPCMKAIRARISEASHAELFSITAFMINRGYSKEDILAMLQERPDFDEKIARYQIEHIAGERGSRIKYKPPSCQTMKAHGLCIEDGKLCPKGIRNPLQYSKTKPRPGPREGGDEEQAWRGGGDTRTRPEPDHPTRSGWSRPGWVMKVTPLTRRDTTVAGWGE